MLLSFLILLPLLGTLIIFIFYTDKNNEINEKTLKVTALLVTVLDLFLSLIIWFLFDNSSKHFQFVQEHYTVGHYDFYLGLDGLSIYFVLLTTLIAPISIISNWKSINSKTAYFLVIMLLLEAALLLIYTVLDILMFYIFFESILAPLFILIGFFGSTDKLRASFYFFLYTFLGSLFMLLSIITVSSLTGCTDMDIIYKTDYAYITQVFLFMGIFVAFAVKTPVIFLNTWLLKAHVESPLSGSVILAAIVLKLSLYGVFRLILPLVPKAFIFYTHIIFVICVITILYASFSTIRTIDVKELIAYSSVSHAAVYFAGILSNVIQGIQGGILLGLAHGFVSSGLFISGGGVLYDRSSTRTINYYGGLAQIMPIFSILFFILCLGNCGAPLTLNFVGEFMSLYGIFERLSLAGILASSSIILSAVYTIFMFNRIIFGGIFKGWYTYLPDLNKREYSILLILVIFTVILGIYPSIILDSLNYSVSTLLYGFEHSVGSFSLSHITNNDAPEPWGLFFQDNATPQMEGLEELHNNIMFYLTIILFAVSWIMLSIILNYKKATISNNSINYKLLVESVWTITPVLIFILIAFPSFKLFYLIDEVLDPSLVIYGEGHQWYWSYQYPNFTNNDEEIMLLQMNISLLLNEDIPSEEYSMPVQPKSIDLFARKITAERYIIVYDNNQTTGERLRECITPKKATWGNYFGHDGWIIPTRDIQIAQITGLEEGKNTIHCRSFPGSCEFKYPVQTGNRLGRLEVRGDRILAQVANPGPKARS